MDSPVPSGSRPRRSAAKAVNYQALFDDRHGIESSTESSADSASDGTGADAEQPRGRKQRRSRGPRKRLAPSEHSDDESSFDPSELASPSEADDDIFAAEDIEPDESLAPSRDSEQFSDGSGVVYVTQPGSSSRTGPKRGARPAGKSNGRPSELASSLKHRVNDGQWSQQNQDIDIQSFPASLRGAVLTHRATTAGQLPMLFRSYGALWYPPNYVGLAGQPASLHHRPNPATEGGRRLISRWHERELFGPAGDLIEDLGWWKGKWKAHGSSEARPAAAAATEGAPLSTKRAHVHVLSAQTDSAVPLECRMGAFEAHDPLQQPKHRLEGFRGYRLDSFISSKPGHLLATQGFPASIDFLHPTRRAANTPEAARDYLSIAIAPTDPGLVGSTGPTTSHGSIQIWSGPASVTSGESRWRLDLVIKLDSCPLAARWRPRPIGPVWTSPLSGDALACLGHLAVATADGQITFYAVPDPSTIGVDRDPDSPHRTVALQPATAIAFGAVRCHALEWGSEDVLACGLSNGSLAVIRPSTALREHLSIERPTLCVPVHQGPIRAIAWIRAPPRATDRQILDDHDPIFLATAGTDGNGYILDLREPSVPMSISHARGAANAISFSAQVGAVVVCDGEYQIREVGLRPSSAGVLKRVAQSSGPVAGLATSDFHTFVAIASGSGTCSVASCQRPWERQRGAELYETIVYRLDCDRRTGELRMVDNIVPELAFPETRPASKPRSRRTRDIPSVDPTSIWPPSVSVTAVAWNPATERSCMLASGTACGIVRLDWVEGRAALAGHSVEAIDRLWNDAGSGDGN